MYFSDKIKNLEKQSTSNILSMILPALIFFAEDFSYIV